MQFENVKKSIQPAATFGPGARNGPSKFKGRRGGSGRGEAARRMLHGKKR